MSNRSRREAASRAEARRRARQIDRGDEPGEVEEEEGADDRASARPAAAGGLLGRLFPAAPPLPNKPDPLAGFNYQGPLGSAVSGLYLLANHPRAWAPMAIAWAVTQIFGALNRTAGAAFVAHFGTLPPNYALIDTIIQIVGAMAILAAGWFGWQRPWLFGAAAVVGGTVIRATYEVSLPTSGAGSLGDGATLFLVILLDSLPLVLFGAFLGWYGGYLRRRMAVAQPPPQRQRRRR
jgi:hypothetical protein